MSHTITADFSGGANPAIDKSAWQYDYGASLVIKGLDLPATVEVHFSTAEYGGTAETRVGTTADGITTVAIPDRLLKMPGRQDYRIYAYIYLTDVDSGHTEYKICIRVRARPKPGEARPDEDKDHPYSDIVQELNRLDKEKLDYPVSPVAGQLLRVKTINGDGTIVLETVEGNGGGGISDVQVDGVSVVDEGVANIPIATRYNAGTVKLAGQGVTINDGSLFTERATEQMIDSRNYYYQPITPANLDYAVKAAMCDGKGAAWTDAEQAATRARLGMNRGFELIGEKGVDKATVAIRIDVPNFAEYDAIFFHLFATNTTSSGLPFRVSITDDVETEVLTYSGISSGNSVNVSGMLFPFIDGNGVKRKHRLYGFFSSSEADGTKTFEDAYGNGPIRSIDQNNANVTFATAKAIIFTCPAPFNSTAKAEVWGRKK